ncbi:MAG: hypothetical protein RI571_06630 [Roseovarius sp.]|nr:hypothetical protein [Roseovarius sp.]
MSARGQAKAEQERGEINAYIGETRATQTATTNVEQLNSELGTLRATLAQNGQGMNAGTMPFFNELSRVRLREGRIQSNNERMGAEDSRMQAKAAGQRAAWAPVIGIGKAAPSLYDMWQLRQ